MMTKLKKLLIALIFGSVVLAAPFVYNEIEINKIPGDLKLKCSKDKIYYSKEIKKEIDVDGNEINVDKVEYWYVELDVADENEIIEKRTKNAKYFTTTKKGEIAMEISVGLPYEKIGDFWYIHKKDRILKKYYDKQTKSAFQRILKLKPIYATDVNEQLGANTDSGIRRTGSINDFKAGVWADHSVGARRTGVGDATCYRANAGARFQTVDVPQGSTINTAYMTITAKFDISTTVVRTKLDAEDIDDAPTFVSDDLSDWDDRIHTTNYTEWDNISAWTLDNEYNSPSIVSCVQEVISRNGWVANNDLIIFWLNDGSDETDNTDVRRKGWSYSGAAAKSPKLFISYTAAERRVIKIE